MGRTSGSVFFRRVQARHHFKEGPRKRRDTGQVHPGFDRLATSGAISSEVPKNTCQR